MLTHCQFCWWSNCHIRTVPSSPVDASIVPVTFHCKRHTSNAPWSFTATWRSSLSSCFEFNWSRHMRSVRSFDAVASQWHDRPKFGAQHTSWMRSVCPTSSAITCHCRPDVNPHTYTLMQIVSRWTHSILSCAMSWYNYLGHIRVTTDENHGNVETIGIPRQTRDTIGLSQKVFLDDETVSRGLFTYGRNTMLVILYRQRPLWKVHRVWGFVHANVSVRGGSSLNMTTTPSSQSSVLYRRERKSIIPNANQDDAGRI